MNTDHLIPHLDALEAELQLALARIGQMRQAIGAYRPKPPRQVLPERCAGIDAEQCAAQNDEARMSRASFGNPNGWQCAGCRYEGASVVT